MTKTLVYNSYELNQLLEKKYGTRLNVEPLLAMMGSIEGTLDSKSFNITFKGNEYLATPYRGFCEEYLGEWCGDAICIMKKSEAKSLIKTFEEVYIYFDLGGVIDG